MKKLLNYIAQAFGFNTVSEFNHSAFSFPVSGNGMFKIAVVSSVAAAFRMYLQHYTGMDVLVFSSFCGLIAAEFFTGIKVARICRNEKIQSWKIGRMILKIGTYVFILTLLNSFANGISAPDVLGIEINPFKWLYFAVLTIIVFQLFISWLENLGCLGYNETTTILGVVLKKFNKWFELDGTKNKEKNNL